MSRDEFMRELEYLLQDIPETEKADAIEYYRDYLEEAGPEHEEEVIREFGSPERIASIIRSDISGSLEDGGEFTDKGYEDGRFKDPNYQMANRFDLPEVSDHKDYKEDSGYKKKHKKKDGFSHSGRRRNIVLWIILICVASPLLSGLGGALAGLVGVLFGLLVSAVVGIGAVTVVLLGAGAAMVPAGFVSMAIHPISGILLLGLGILFLGLGLLALAASGAFYGKFLPFLLRSCINAVSSVFHRRRYRS